MDPELLVASYFYLKCVKSRSPIRGLERNRILGAHLLLHSRENCRKVSLGGGYVQLATRRLCKLLEEFVARGGLPSGVNRKSNNLYFATLRCGDGVGYWMQTAGIFAVANEHQDPLR